MLRNKSFVFCKCPWAWPLTPQRGNKVSWGYHHPRLKVEQTHCGHIVSRSNTVLGLIRRNLSFCNQQVKQAAYMGLDVGIQLRTRNSDPTSLRSNWDENHWEAAGLLTSWYSSIGAVSPYNPSHYIHLSAPARQSRHMPSKHLTQPFLALMCWSTVSHRGH